ncbi:hypothetical protein ACFL6C_00380 [Myxococcota bacterium]
MAQKLGEMLISRGLLTPEQLYQALQSQGQVGGRLGTCLVELGFLTEHQLATTLSQQLGIPFVDASQVANIPSNAVALVSRELAEQYRAVPFQLHDRVVHVCMSDPADLGQVDELSFRLNRPVKPFVVTEVTLNYALERYYNIPRQIRGVDFSPMSAGGSFVQLSDGSASSGIRVGRAELYNPATGQPAAADPFADCVIPDLREELASVQSADQLLQCVCRFLGTLFNQSAILSLKQGHAVGLLMVDSPGGSHSVNGVHVPIVEGSLLHEAIKSLRVFYRDEVDDDLVSRLCTKLQIVPRSVTLLPILEGRSVAYVALCQGVSRGQLDRVFPQLRLFLTQVSYALQILAFRHAILSSA